ncbi:MAG: Sec-independent protein translocase TatC [Thermoplasmata archaeon]
MANELFSLLQNNIDELRFRAIRILIVFFAFFVVFFTFRVDIIVIFGKRIPMIYPDPYSNVGGQFLELVEKHVLPKNMELIAVKPTDSMISDLYSVMFLSLVFSMPYIVNQIGKFIAPGLKKREIETIRFIGIPAALLFAAGAGFGFWYIFPLLFRIFFYFNSSVGAADTMSVSSFTSFFFIYIASFGLSFELPIIMIGLTKLHLVSSEFWMRNWRYAVVGSLIFGLIFSPGVVGVSMMIMAIPMMLLYILGAYISRRIEKNEDTSENERQTADEQS